MTLNMNKLENFSVTMGPNEFPRYTVEGTGLINNGTIDISPGITIGTDFSDEIYKKILERFAKAPIVQHKCHNCGATVEIDENKHIFICKYCNSVYAIGTTQINDRG